MEQHRITGIRHLTDSTYVVQMERRDLQFKTGQFVIVRTAGSLDQREYSIYSGENDDYLEVLVREVTNGKVSPRLKDLAINTLLEVDGPFGFFKFQPEHFQKQSFLFVATGTGISPFHSFIRTYPDLDYKLVHGVRYVSEAYDHHAYNASRLVMCTTGENGGNYYGRVTDYLASQRIDSGTNCFLCGNSEMIYEVFDILTAKGIPVSNIYSEVYF